MSVTIKPAPIKPGAKPAPVAPASAVQLIAKDNAPTPAPKLAAAKKVTAKQPEAHIDKKFADGSTESTTEAVGGPVFSEQHATVGVQMSFTMMPEPYQPFKAQVSLFMPCAPTSEGIEEAYVEAKAWVDAKIEEIAQEVQGQMEE